MSNLESKVDTENRIKISVIVPVYNAEQYLEICLDSICKQTLKDFEIILVDDGSTDQSGMLCDEIKSKYLEKQIRVFHNDNGGAAAARNFGVRQAQGEFIAFVDSDDTVTPDYLEYLYQLASDNNAMVAACAYRKVYEKSSENDISDVNESVDTDNLKQGQDFNTAKIENEIGNNEAEKDIEEIYEVHIYPELEGVKNLLYQRDFLSVPWGMISKKELWEKVEFPEGTKAEDMGTIYRLFAESKMTVFGTKPCYDYYQRKNNTMFSTSSVRNIDYHMHSREMVKYIKENYPQLMSAARSRHFSACFQILSETDPTSENAQLLGKVYSDVKKIRKYVWKDKEGKSRNRYGALLSMLSIRFMHFLVRMYYKMQYRKL